MMFAKRIKCNITEIIFLTQLGRKENDKFEVILVISDKGHCLPLSNSNACSFSISMCDGYRGNSRYTMCQ